MVESDWIKHVKAVQAEKGISYSQALREASKTYQKKTKAKPKAGQGIVEDVLSDAKSLFSNQAKAFKDSGKLNRRAGKQLRSGDIGGFIETQTDLNPGLVFGKSIVKSKTARNLLGKQIEKTLNSKLKGKGADPMMPSKVAPHLRPKPMFQDAVILDISKGGIKSKA